jgi:hypothetical protein
LTARFVVRRLVVNSKLTETQASVHGKGKKRGTWDFLSRPATPAKQTQTMPHKGRSNEEIIYALHQVEGGEKVTEAVATSAPASRRSTEGRSSSRDRGERAGRGWGASVIAPGADVSAAIVSVIVAAVMAATMIWLARGGSPRPNPDASSDAYASSEQGLNNSLPNTTYQKVLIRATGTKNPRVRTPALPC